MALLGISILIASLTLICFRHPPSSWTFLEWLRRRRIQELAEEPPNDAPGSIPLQELKPSIPRPPPEPEGNVSLPSPPKIQVDRQAMPPPPPPFTLTKPILKQASPPTSPPTPKAHAAPHITFATDDDSDNDERDSLPPPSFPALNSAQRTSGGTGAPPRLNTLPPQPARGGLMSAPARAPLPNRTVNALRNQAAGTSAGLTPPPSLNGIPSKPRKKVLLTPGHSPLDWARLTSSPTSNLRGLPPGTPFLKVPPSLLKQHNGRKGKDAWTVLKGKVYNITPYVPFHPGGEPELLRCAGRDGTRLFGEVHPWVNYGNMLSECLVGIAIEEREPKGELDLESMD